MFLENLFLELTVTELVSKYFEFMVLNTVCLPLGVLSE